MSITEDRQLDELVRVVQPDQFGKVDSRSGLSLAFDTHLEQASESHWLRNPFARKDRFVYYCVSFRNKPLAIKGWTFKWVDAASNMELEFTASCSVDLPSHTAEAAKKLVVALHRSGGPAQGLYALIDRALHIELNGILRDRDRDDNRFLSEIEDANGKTRSGLALNIGKYVEERTGAIFEIGLSMANLPERYLSIDRHQTDFALPDLQEPRHVMTSARLELVNLQRFRRSGLNSRTQAEERIRHFIDTAVQEFVFGKPYYDIAREFEPAEESTIGAENVAYPMQTRESSIKHRIKGSIEAQANEIGYSIRIFQSRPNIDALRLIQSFRVELRVEDGEFRPKFSTGYVRVGVVVEVRALDFSKVARLIEPGLSEDRIRAILEGALKQICHDEIQQTDRKDFNLSFGAIGDEGRINGKPTVVQRLRDALKRAMELRYGLQVNVVNISQGQTEEGERFSNLRGKAFPFVLDLTFENERGSLDDIRMNGKFEVVGIKEEFWDRFESKDFGYRRDSVVWSSEDLRELRGTHSDDDFNRLRKAAAIQRELKEIGSRVASLLHNLTIAERGTFVHESGLENVVGLEPSMADKVIEAIQAEFGVTIEFRELQRSGSELGKSQAEIRAEQRKALLVRSVGDLERSEDLKAVAHAARREHLEELFRMRKDALSLLGGEERTAKLAEIEELIKLAANGSDWEAVTPGALLGMVDPRMSGRPATPLLGNATAAGEGE